MKYLMSLCLGLMSSTILAQTIVCSTGPDVSPNDVFIINLSNESDATVEYQRFPFYGAEILPFTQDIQGCNPAQYYMMTSSEVYIECDGDGDAGYISLNFTKDTIFGTVNFPEGNIGYSEDTSLDVSCYKQSL